MNLNIGLGPTGKPFTLEPELAVQKLALLGISGSGKSCTASVIGEEMCKASLPWIALDPVGIWYGLKATREGKPSQYPVVVFGGDHQDLPLEKGSGAKIAEALVTENVFAVIDLSLESKKFWHQFVTDFALTLMKLNPETQRHIFIEEAPEFIPQKAKFELTARCKEAVERLVRLGRNRGYGYTLITQRPATVDKDALSQCDNLFVLRTVGAHDRKALQEWLQGKSVSAVEKFLADLPKLANGTGYFWSPQWRKEFTKVRVRERETFHPGETRMIGKSQKAVALCDVRQFVERLKPQLSKTVVSVPSPSIDTMTGGNNISSSFNVRMPRVRQINSAQVAYTGNEVGADLESISRATMDNTMDRQRINELTKENQSLREAVAQADHRAKDAARRLETVRKALQPQYEALKGLFGELEPSNGQMMADASVYEPWLHKAGNGTRRRMFEVILQRRELTRPQLSTLSGVSINSSGFKNNLSWYRVNKLVDVEGDIVRLRQV
jgi:hypothetical protein